LSTFKNIFLDGVDQSVLAKTFIVTRLLTTFSICSEISHSMAYGLTIPVRDLIKCKDFNPFQGYHSARL